MSMESKKKIVYTLISFTVLLILFNVVLGLLHQDEIKVENNNDVSRLDIETSFSSVIKKFGIKESWVKKKSLNDKALDSISYKYKIEIPVDVPIPMILKELSDKLKNGNAKVTSTEKKNFGSTILKIKTGQCVKLIAEINYKKEIVREHSSIAFVIKSIDKLSETEFETLLKTPIKFSALLPLQIESVEIAEKILKSKRTYYIFLDDDSDNVKFELDEDINVNSLKKNVGSIVSSFNSPQHFFISSKGTGFSNSFINFLKNEFKRKERIILNLNSFVNLKGENKKDLISLLNFHLNNIKSAESKTFFIEIDDWESIQSSINEYLKKGNKLKLPSQLL